MTMWNPDLSVFTGPRYLAIADALQLDIASGTLPVGTRLPTHRALADRLGVTVGTITRAYAEAERRGLLEARVGSGTFVRLQGQLTQASWKISRREAGWANLGINIPVPDERAGPLRQALEQVFSHTDLDQLMEYHEEAGLPAHREGYLQWLQRIGLQPDISRLFLTSGAQHGIMLSLLAMTQPGDLILTEELTYPGLLITARKLSLKVQAVPMDHEGPQPEAFEQLCKERRPRLLYCTPTLQNPTTRTQSLARRQALLAICERYGVWVIEDDINGWLPEQRPATMASLLPERVVHIGGVSKALSGGIRVGSLVVPDALLERVKETFRADCWMTSPLLTAVVCQWLENGEAVRLLQRQRDAMHKRRELAAQYLGRWQLEHSAGAQHAWLPLPEPWLAHQFVQQAMVAQVEIKGSDSFVVGRHPAPHGIRLALSHPATLAELETGLQRLQALLQVGPDLAPGVI